CCCACHASSLCPCALVMPPRRPRSPTRSRWCRLGGGTTGNYFLPSANIPPGPSQEAEKMRPGGHNGWRCSEVAISYIREGCNPIHPLCDPLLPTNESLGHEVLTRLQSESSFCSPIN
uniref:Uncharacterized protein n=4 Tax=Aegilops tauschii subsp. strangulata TaxID=200361 RepID=A0A453R107_AEGTS